MDLERGNIHILVMNDAFSRWVELFPTKTRVHTDQGPAFCNELFSKLARLTAVEHSFATAYSKEENGIVERANQEVMRHLRAMLFDAHVHDKWSFDQLPMVQRIMNTVEKTSTGVTPAELILNNSIRLTSRIRSANPTCRVALSDTMDNYEHCREDVHWSHSCRTYPQQLDMKNFITIT